jgi:hypothetical protein
MSKQSEAVKQWRKNTKQKIIIAMGGKCQICNYNKCNEALDLHHIDPVIKEMSFGAMRASPKSWLKISEELKKCILLCANCHREIHSNMVTLPEQYQQFDESLLQTKEAKETIQIKAPLEITFCPICNTEKPKTNVYCSYSCAAKSQKHTKFDWPNIDLIDMIENQKIPKTQIADQLGCSDVAVYKRYKKLKAAA